MLGEALQRVVQGDELGRAGGLAQGLVVEGHDGDGPAALVGELGLGVVDEEPAHRQRGDGQEVRPRPPLDALLAEEVQERLVGQCGGLQRVVVAFARHLGSGQSPKFFVHEGEQRICGVVLARGHAGEELRDFAGGAHPQQRYHALYFTWIVVAFT